MEREKDTFSLISPIGVVAGASSDQANLNNQVEKININDSRDNINSNHHHPPPTTNSSNSIRISINMTTNSSNSICISINMTSQRPRPSNLHQH